MVASCCVAGCRNKAVKKTTKKFLSYLSRCAGGRISDEDQEIIESSWFVNNLLPGLIFQLTLQNIN